MCWSGMAAQERLVEEVCRRGETDANHHLHPPPATNPLHNGCFATFRLRLVGGGKAEREFTGAVVVAPG